MAKTTLQAAALLALALPAHGEAPVTLRIEAALAAVGQAPGIDAASTDIVHLERIDADGPALAVQLHPRFEDALADLTANRVGQRLIIYVCGQVVLEPLLNDRLQFASLLITSDDPVFLDEVEAALRAPSCINAPIG